MHSRSVTWFQVALAALSSVGWVLADDLPIEPEPKEKSIAVGRFPVETLHVFTTRDGLPSDDVACVLNIDDKRIVAGTAKGLARWDQGKWRQVGDRQEPVLAIAAHGGHLLFVQGRALIEAPLAGESMKSLATLPANVAEKSPISLVSTGRHVYLGGDAGLFVLVGDRLMSAEGYDDAIGEGKAVRQLAAGPNGELAVAAMGGLLLKSASGEWRRPAPRHEKRSWSPHDVRGVTYDRAGRLWFASLQGVGCRDELGWKLYTGADGLPYDDFTGAASGEPDAVWFGTNLGAIRFDGTRWNYRRSRRWTPDDHVRCIAVESNGNAWMATPKGIGLLERRPMTLAEKARFFEDEIDKYHRRTPYGYVGGVTTGRPGEKVDIQQHDSDNDGLWTAMYGAGECFAYAATKDPQAKRRATAAFEALKFLSDVTQGGSHPAPKGFPARSILPTDGRDPNLHDSPEHDRRRQENDPFWKVITPRWPVSADGKWYWKSDTSSDELDGHFFFYALYHDFAADTAAEKERVKQVVFDIASHLVEHDYQLIDHDGKPTRWGRFNTAVLDQGHMIDARGLNSLSILTYLKIAERLTDDPKFRRHYEKLIREHGYAANAYTPKVALGYGTGNQSDDEMAFMCYYNLLRYETDPVLLKAYHYSFSWYWSLERPERNPLFNFIFAAMWKGADGYPARSVPLWALEDAVDTLKNFPLDRFNWEFKNSHRIDIVPLKDMWFRNTGYRIDGKVVPVDERHFEFWNHNPWRLDGGGDGRHLSDGAAFLLPYYLGKYHQFIKE